MQENYSFTKEELVFLLKQLSTIDGFLIGKIGFGSNLEHIYETIDCATDLCTEKLLGKSK